MIILTGGAGFIGSCILAGLNKQGHTDVLVVDSLRSGNKWKNISGSKYRDIINKDVFRQLMKTSSFDTVDAVIHMGACSSTTSTNNDYLYDNNFRFSVEVAEFAFQHNARFIYASSAATYGSGQNGFDDSLRNLQPLNMYGYSKHLFDEWIRDNNYDVRCVGLKFFNVYGPNEYHKGDQASMVWKSFVQAKQSGTIKLFASNTVGIGNGEQTRDFVYVFDVVRLTLQLIDRGDINGIYNLGTGVANTWNALAQAVSQAIGSKVTIEYIPMPEALSGQYQNHTQANMMRLHDALPGLHFTSLEDGVTDYVQNYLEQPWPYEPQPVRTREHS